MLCFRATTLGGARIDYIHIQVREEASMLPEGGQLQVPAWTDCGFPTMEEAGGPAPVDDDGTDCGDAVGVDGSRGGGGGGGGVAGSGGGGGGGASTRSRPTSASSVRGSGSRPQSAKKPAKPEPERFPCCRGADGNLHYVVKSLESLFSVEEGPRVWVLFRIRVHNYAGWGKWMEMRSAVPFP